jgi:cytochrome c-type biogenesis protein CcmH/NrfF
MLRNVIVGIAVLVTFGVALAQERPSSPEYRDACTRLMCQCGCNQTIANCSMEHCHSAEPIREEIWERLQKGESVASIIKVFTDRYGLVILSAPPAEGIHLLAWMTPIFAFLIGLFVTWQVLRSWRRQTPSTESAAESLSDAQRARIERDLRDLPS